MSHEKCNLPLTNNVCWVCCEGACICADCALDGLGEGGYLGPEKAFVRTEQRLDPADHLDDQVEKLYFRIVPFGLESCRHHQSHCHAYHLGLCHGGPSSHHMQARASICPRMM